MYFMSKLCTSVNSKSPSGSLSVVIIGRTSFPLTPGIYNSFTGFDRDLEVREINSNSRM